MRWTSSHRHRSVPRFERTRRFFVLMVVVTMVAACGGGSSQPSDDPGTSQPSGDAGTSQTETTSDESVDNGDPDESESQAVEGAFVYAMNFRSGELWAFNPDTGAGGIINTIETETQRLWVTAAGLWLASSTELVHVDTSGEERGVIELPSVYQLVGDDDEAWIAGSPPSSAGVDPYLSKLEAATHSEVASLAAEDLTGESGRFESVAMGDDAVWVSYTTHSGRDTEIDKLDRDSLEVVATTTVPVGSPGLFWDGGALWAAGQTTDSSGFGVVQIASDGAVASEWEIADFEGRTGSWDFVVADGAIWLADFGTGALIRLDAASGSETARIEFAELGRLESIHLSDGRVWASVHRGSGSYLELTLYLIDPDRNEAEAMMDLPERLQGVFVP